MLRIYEYVTKGGGVEDGSPAFFLFQKSTRRSSVKLVIGEFSSNYENLNDFNLVRIPHEFT
jgi:hypothetical protein